MEVVMRRARREDADAINEIFNQAVEEGNSNLDIDSKDRAYREEWLADHDGRHPVYVGEMDGTVVCWVSLSPYSQRYPYDWIADLSIDVRRDLRGKGLGSQLLRFIEQRAEELGYYKIVLSVFGGNLSALHTYRRAGYRDVGVFRGHGYYKGRLVDIVFMERLLTPDMDRLKDYYQKNYPWYQDFFDQEQAEEEAHLRRNGMLPPLEGAEEEEFEEVKGEHPGELPEGIVRFLRSKKKPDYRRMAEIARREREAAEAPASPQAPQKEEPQREATPGKGEKKGKAPARKPRGGTWEERPKTSSPLKPERKKRTSQEEEPLEGQLNLEDVISRQ